MAGDPTPRRRLHAGGYPQCPRPPRPSRAAGPVTAAAIDNGGWLHTGGLATIGRRRVRDHHRPQERTDHHRGGQEHLPRQHRKRGARRQATRRTLARIATLFSGHLPSATELLGADPAKLREAGLSWRKIGTLRDLAGRLSDGRLDPKVLCSLPDDEIMAELTAIPGIGPWTVHGALLLLGREDVVVPGDLRVRKAVQAAYRLDHLPTQEEVLAIADKWRPYRSLATSYLFTATFAQAKTPPAAPRKT